MPSVNVYSVKDVFSKVNHSFYLPDIQRDYRWDEKRVVDLFDSLMKDYPIGTFLIWKQSVSEYDNSNYYLYKFISTATATDNTGDKLEKPAHTDKKYIYAVLDGQQRLTSLFLALNGGYEVWRGRGRHPNTTPPLRELYFSPAGRSGKNYTTSNEFSFFSSTNLPDKGWYKVKDIYKARSADQFCKDNNITTRPEQVQTRNLYDVLRNKKTLSFYEIPLKYSADDAVNIFLRLNSGGVPLKRTELLFALAINNWHEGRPEIESFLKDLHGHPKTYGDWKNIDKDFVLKTCLVLFEKQISMSVDELRQVDFSKISTHWVNITKSINDVLIFLDEKGHGATTIKSENAIIPLIYYRYNNPKSFEKDSVKKELFTLFILLQINNVFSASTDSTLLSIRKVMDCHIKKDFSFSAFSTEYGKNEKDPDILKCDKDVIKSWVVGENSFEKDENTLLLLSSLSKYIDRGNSYYEQDHLHPSKAFKDDNTLNKIGLNEAQIKEWRDIKDSLGNLQLYKERSNKKKSSTSLKEWKSNNKKWEIAYDPAESIKKSSGFQSEDDPYDFKYAKVFIEKRSEIIIDELSSLLL